MSVNAPVKVAVVGPSGGGKTTVIAQLLQHLRRSGSGAAAGIGRSASSADEEDPFYAPASAGELPESAVWTPGGRSLGDDRTGGSFGVFCGGGEVGLGDPASPYESPGTALRPMSSAVTIHAASREVTIATCPTVSVARSPAAVLLNDGNDRPMPIGGPFASNRASVTSDRHMSSRRSIECFSRVNSGADMTALLKGVRLECHARLFDVPGMHPPAGVKRAVARCEVVLVVVDVAAAADGVPHGDDDALCDSVMRTVRDWASVAMQAANRTRRNASSPASPAGTTSSLRRRSTGGSTGVLSRIRAALSRTPLGSARTSRTGSPVPGGADGVSNPFAASGASSPAAPSARRLSRNPSGSSVTAVDELVAGTPVRHRSRQHHHQQPPRNAYDDMDALSERLSCYHQHSENEQDAPLQAIAPHSSVSSSPASPGASSHPLAPPSILVALNRSDVADITPNHLRTLQRNVATALEHAEWASTAPQCRVVISSARNPVTIAALTDAVFALAGAALEITGLDRGGSDEPSPMVPPSPPRQEVLRSDRSPRADSPIGISFDCSPLTNGTAPPGRSLPVQRHTRHPDAESPSLPVNDTVAGSFIPPPGTSLARGLGLFGSSVASPNYNGHGSSNNTHTKNSDAPGCRTASSQHGPFFQNRASED